MSQRYLRIILSGKKGPSSVPVDHKRAFELFADAAGQGYGLAQADSASAYDSCLGVAPLLELSIFWYSKVAMQGVVSARRNLAASHYRKGIDDKFVPATAPIALVWARRRPPPTILTLTR
jgi:TPR repeat protein